MWALHTWHASNEYLSTTTGLGPQAQARSTRWGRAPGRTPQDGSGRGGGGFIATTGRGCGGATPAAKNGGWRRASPRSTPVPVAPEGRGADAAGRARSMSKTEGRPPPPAGGGATGAAGPVGGAPPGGGTSAGKSRHPSSRALRLARPTNPVRNASNTPARRSTLECLGQWRSPGQGTRARLTRWRACSPHHRQTKCRLTGPWGWSTRCSRQGCRA